MKGICGLSGYGWCWQTEPGGGFCISRGGGQPKVWQADSFPSQEHVLTHQKLLDRKERGTAWDRGREQWKGVAKRGVSLEDLSTINNHFNQARRLQRCLQYFLLSWEAMVVWHYIPHSFTCWVHMHLNKQLRNIYTKHTISEVSQTDSYRPICLNRTVKYVLFSPAFTLKLLASAKRRRGERQ